MRRWQPDEAVYLVTVAKEPGITADQVRKPVVMDMTFASQFEGAYIGDAYERMFLNCARGDQERPLCFFQSDPLVMQRQSIAMKASYYRGTTLSHTKMQRTHLGTPAKSPKGQTLLTHVSLTE